MRKLTFLFVALAAVVMIGCTKPEDNNGKKPDIEEPNPQKEFSFTMTLNKEREENPNHNYSNIYIDISNYKNDVKERMIVPFDITIKDTDPEKNIVYMLKPVDKTDVQRHQVLNKDFEFGTIVSIGTNHFNKLDKIKIKGLKGKAKIRPLEPGTFQLDFQLQKYDTIAKKYIGDPIVTRASAFNVVKIIAEVRGEKLEWKVLDGDQQDDKYLSNYSVFKEYEYDFKCGKIKRAGDFKEGYIRSIDLKEFGGEENLPAIFDLKIRQVFKNGNFNDIEYKNIIIKKQ